MKVTLDSNVLVRLATQDDAAQAAKALQVLQKATQIVVPTPALCDLVWVLPRGCRYTPAQVAQEARLLKAQERKVNWLRCGPPHTSSGGS